MTWRDCPQCAASMNNSPDAVWRESSVTYVLLGVSFEKHMHTIEHGNDVVETHHVRWQPPMPEAMAREFGILEFDILPGIIRVRTPRCCVCKKSSVLEVDGERYAEWQRGTYVQTAFPEMPDDDRELLVSGTHPECWALLGDD